VPHLVTTNDEEQTGSSTGRLFYYVNLLARAAAKF